MLRGILLRTSEETTGQYKENTEVLKLIENQKNLDAFMNESKKKVAQVVQSVEEIKKEIEEDKISGDLQELAGSVQQMRQELKEVNEMGL